MKDNKFLMIIFLIVLLLVLFGTTGCMNTIKAEVPNKVEQCFKDPKTGECTNEAVITVKHIVSIELPSVFTDECKRIWNETDYPDKSIRDAGYSKCISDYLNQIMEVIGNLNPADLPPVP